MGLQSGGQDGQIMADAHEGELPGGRLEATQPEASKAFVVFEVAEDRFNTLAALLFTTAGPKITTERRSFLTSLPAEARIFAHAAHGHWVLDASLNEDQSRSRTDNATENPALLHKIALNCLRHESKHTRKRFWLLPAKDK